MRRHLLVALRPIIIALTFFAGLTTLVFGFVSNIDPDGNPNPCSAEYG
jgi:hypothetical protein